MPPCFALPCEKAESVEKKQKKGKLVFPKIPKDYKPLAKVMAMTLGKLPEGVDLEKEIIWMKTQETATI